MANHQFLLSFLENMSEDIAKLGTKIEETVFVDSRTACLNGRVLLESIVDAVLREENEEESLRMRLFEKVHLLDRQGILANNNRTVRNSMETLRMNGNKASHETHYDDIEHAIKTFKAAYIVSKWFVEVYSHEELSIPDYRNPVQQEKNDLSEEKVEEMLKNILQKKSDEFFPSPVQETESNSYPEPLIDKELPEPATPLSYGKSYLFRELKRLQESSKEAIESPEAFSSFKQYMHVTRKIQTDLEKRLEQAAAFDGPSLVILSGSVGDGKSHLLSYLKNERQDIMSKFELYNDATESNDPTKTAVETLTEELADFSDQMKLHSNKKVIIAMNLGILNKFLKADHGELSFTGLQDFIEKSGIFSDSQIPFFSNDPFHIISFSEYQAFELTEQGPASGFFKGILEKVFVQSLENPFYTAYLRDCRVEEGFEGIIHDNYRFMMNSFVQEHVVQVLIQTIIHQKLVISARSVFNFIADILIPEGYREESELEWGTLELLQNSTPNLLFARKERSFILKVTADLDPIHYRHKRIDQLVIKLNTLDNWDSIIKGQVEGKESYDILRPFLQERNETLQEGEFLLRSTEEEFTKALIRTAFLDNDKFFKDLLPGSYSEYMNYLYHFNRGNRTALKDFYASIRSAVFKWKGSPDRNYLYINDYIKFKVAQELKLYPDLEHIKEQSEEKLYTFSQAITISFKGSKSLPGVKLPVDYHLYNLLKKVTAGYCPNPKDEEDAVQFVEFIEKVSEFGSYNRELLIDIPTENKKYKLEKSDFGGYIFEKE